MSAPGQHNHGTLTEQSTRMCRHVGCNGEAQPCSCTLPHITDLITAIDGPESPFSMIMDRDTHFEAISATVGPFRADSMSPINQWQKPTIHPSPTYVAMSREANLSSSSTEVGLLVSFDSESASYRGRSSSFAPEEGRTSPSRKTCTPCRRNRQRRRGPVPKKDKEQQSRKEHRCFIQNLEDILQYVAGVYRHQYRAQTSGNATVSGLEWAKSEILCGIAAIAAYRMQQLRDDAIMNGTLEKFERDNTRIFEQALAEKEPLRLTSLWSAGDRRCDHEDGKKTCTVHGGSDWTLCRKALVKANLARHDKKIAAIRRGRKYSARL